MKAIYRRLSILLAVAMFAGNVLLPAANATPAAASSAASPVSSGVVPASPARASRAFSRAGAATSRAYARLGGVRLARQTGTTRASRAAQVSPSSRPQRVAQAHRAAAIRPSDSSGNPTFSPNQNPLDAGVQVTGTTTNSYLYIYNSANSSTGASAYNRASSSGSSGGASAPLTITNVSVVAQPGDTAAGDYQIIPSTNGYSGDCTSGVAPNNNYCYVEVAFTPSALGSRTAHLQFTDNAPDSPQTVAVSGTGVLPIPQASLSPGAQDFGVVQVAPGSSADNYFTLFNTGTAPLTITNIAVITGTGDTSGADFALLNGGCQAGQALARNSTCSVGVRFAPSATGTRTAHLQVTDNAGNVDGSVQTAAISGTGTPAAPIAVFDYGNSANGFGFGDYPVGRATTPGYYYVPVQNTGFQPLTISSISIAAAASGDNAPSDFAVITGAYGAAYSNACATGNTLNHNDSCYIYLTFSPSDLGSRQATLRVADNAAGSPRGLTLTGNGVAPSETFSAQSGLDFGKTGIGAGVTDVITLTNTGAQDIYFYNPPIRITEQNGPASSAGPMAAAAHKAQGASTHTATAPRAPAPRPAGGSGVHSANSATVRANGVSGGGGTGPDAHNNFAETDSCPSNNTLAVGASCAITVTFTPQGPGSYYATLADNNSASHGPDSIPLTGTASVNPADRLAFAWGYDGYGQLGAAGPNSSYNRPVLTQGISNAVSIAASGDHSLAVTADGSVYAWGYNANGELGNGGADYNAHSNPTQVISPTDPTQPLMGAARVAAGANFSLALMKDGTVYAWGYDGYGQLGTSLTSGQSATPVQVTLASGDPLANVVAIAAGSNHALALLKDGSVYAWGRNYEGQLGNGSTSNTSTPVRVADPSDSTRNLANITAIAAGGYHSLFLTASGTVYATGDNDNGQLGDGTTTRRSVPVTVTSLGPIMVTAIAAGLYHSLAVAADGTVYAWGLNNYGQLGSGTTQDSAGALQVAGLTGVAAVAAGDYTSLALLRDGTARAWGNNGYGQLGNNSTSSSSTPVAVTGLSSAVALAAGSYHALALSGPLPPPARGATARLSADALAFGSQSVGVTSAARAITVTNTGGSPLSIAASVAGAGYTLASNTCAGTTLAAGASCALGVTFTPGAAGPRPGALTVSDASDGAQTVSLGGVGVLPRARFNTTSVDFGEQQIDRASPNNGGHVVQVTNNGQGALRFDSLTVVSATAGDNAPADFAVITNTNYYGYQPCPTSTGTAALAPGATCDIYLTFTPSITGTRQATLVTTSNDPATTPYSVTLTGTGIDPGAALAPASGVDFGPQLVYSTSATRTVTLTNAGSTALKIYSLSLTNGSDFSQSNTCPSYYYYSPQVLAPGASCVVSVTFTPQASGPRYSALTVYDNLYNESSQQSYSVQTAPLMGTGAGPIVALSGPALSGNRPSTSLNLGAATTGLAASKVFTLTNSGDAPLHVTAPISIAGPNAGDFAASSGCGATVAAGASCAITVTFRPSTNGARTATLGLNDDAGDSPQRVTLTGRGLFPAADRPLYAWGLADNGRLGTTVPNSCNNMYPHYPYYCGNDTFTPTQVDAISGSLSVAAGNAHTLVVAPDHTVYAWGYNGYGQLGAGDTTDRATAVQVASPFDASRPLTNVVAVAAGTHHSLVLTADGLVYAWGRNYEGELGSGDTTQRATPVTVTVASGAPLTNVVSIAAGNYHSLAVTSGGAVYAWGDNDNGQLGVGDTARRYTAVPVASPFDATQPMTGIVAVAGGNSFSLFLSTSGAVYGVGYNNNGQLGTGDTTQQTAPVTVTSLAGVAVQAIAASDNNFSLALASDGTVYAWGYNGYGQLGSGDTTESHRAHQVGGLSGVVAVAANGDHSMALLQDGTVRGWGADYYGQLGDGSNNYNTTRPTTVTGLVNVVAIAAGDVHSVALSGAPNTTGGGDINPTALAFGQQQVGTTSTALTVTVNNTTGAPIQVTNVAVITDTADFTVTNDGCTNQQLADSSASCAIGVVFAPGSRSAHRGGLSITTSAGATPHIVALGGIGTAPIAGPDTTGIDFGDRQAGTTTGARYVTLYNNGDAPLAISSVTIDGPNSGDFAASATNCGATVAAGSSCYIGVTFAPSDILTRTAALEIADNSINGMTQTVALTGTGVNPGARVSPSTLTFGRQGINTTSAPLTVTVVNTGTTGLSISQTYADGDYSAAGASGGNTCAGATIAPGARCVVPVTFAPTGSGGVERSTLHIVDNVGNGSAQTVALIGTGVNAADLALSLVGGPDPAPVGGQLTYTATVTDIGPADATSVVFTDTLPAGVTFVSASPSSCALSGATVTCTFDRLAADPNASNHQVNVVIVVSPSTSGTAVDTAGVTAAQADLNPSNNTASFTSAVGTRTDAVSATSIDYGRVPLGQVVTATVNVTATGTASVRVYGVTVDGANAAEFTPDGGCSGVLLAPGTSCTIAVAFTPGDIGARAARLTITDNARDGSHQVTLGGTGTAPRVALGALDFGSQQIGATVTRTLTLANSGNSDLQISRVYLTGGSRDDFVLSDPNGCASATIAAGASCDVSVAFTPQRAGRRTTTLAVQDNAPASPQGVEIAGSGRGTIVQGVTTDRNAATTPSFYRVGDSVVVSATVLDADNNPAPDAAVTATLTMTSANNPVLATLPLTNSGGGDVYTATISETITTAPGVYVLAVAAARPGAAPTPYPTYNTFVVSTPTLALGATRFPGPTHQGDVTTVAAAVLNFGYNADGGSLELDEVDGSGNVLTTLVTQTVSGIPARSGHAATLSFDTTKFAEGTHHLRLSLTGLPSSEDPAATIAVSGDLSIIGAQPAIAVAPSPLNISVGVSGTAVAPVTVTNGASIATLSNIVMSLASLGRPGAQDIPWLTLSSPSLADVGPGGAGGFTITASPPTSVAPGLYQTYLVVSAQGVATQYIPVSVIVDSGHHGPLRFIVTAPNGVGIAGATIKATEQVAPYTTLNATADDHGLATIAGVSTDIPYVYTIDSPGFASAQDNVTLNSEDGKSVPVTLQVGAVKAYWSVTPITITDSYNVVLHQTFETDLPVPRLLVVPQVLQFDDNNPTRSGTMTVYNTSRVTVDNVVVHANNTSGVQFTLTYTDTATGNVISGSSITLPGIRGQSQAAIHYEATSSCAPGGPASDPNNPEADNAPKYASSYITAEGTYQYFPNVATPSLDIAHGQGLQGSTNADMVVGRSLSNTGYGVMSGSTATDTAAGGLLVDVPNSIPDLAPGDPATPLPFTVHTTGLVPGVYTSTVTLRATGTPDASLAFTATVDAAGNVLLDYDFTAGVPAPKTGTITAIPAEVRDVYCFVQAPPEPPQPMVGFGPDGNFNISIPDGPGQGQAAPPNLPGVQVPPKPTLVAHEVVKLDIPQRISLERQAFSADLQLTDVTRQPLAGVTVTLHVADSAGNERAGDFAITKPGTTGYSPGDNLGGIDPGATADNRWTLVPAPGLGGQIAAGQVYSVTASYQYSYNGNPVVQTTQPVTITIFPMPQLQISYAIPRDIKAFTPFKLGVIVRNIGYGPAHNMQIQSGQPKIVGNASGAQLHFTLLGAKLSGSSVPVQRGSLNLPIGEIGPGETKAGYWTMVTDVPGQFTGFDATYQEQPFQGLTLSPLILGIRTYIVTHSGAVPSGGTELQVSSVNTNNPSGQSAEANALVDLESGATDALYAITPTIVQTATLSNKTAIMTTPPITNAGYLLAVVTDTLPPAGLQQGTITRITVDDDNSRFLGIPRILPTTAYWQQEDLLSPGDSGLGAEAAAQAARAGGANGPGVGTRADPVPPTFVQRVYLLDAPTGAATYTIYYGATPRQAPAISLSQDSGSAGSYVRVTSTAAFTPSDTVAITMGTVLVDSNVIVDENGTVSDYVTVPNGLLGPQTVTMCDSAGDICASAPFTATRYVPPTGTPTGLPTGTPTATGAATPAATPMGTGTAGPTGTPPGAVTPSATATSLPTAIGTAPTAAPTVTARPTATATATPSPTATATSTPVPTATATSTPVPTATRTSTTAPSPVPTATRTTAVGIAAATATAPALPGQPAAIVSGTPYPTATAYPTEGARSRRAAATVTPITIIKEIVIPAREIGGRIASAVAAAARPRLTLDRAAAHIGDRLCARGSGFLGHESVTIAVDSLAVATTATSAAGVFTACFAAPGTIMDVNEVTAVGTRSMVPVYAAFHGLVAHASTFYFAGGSSSGGDTTELALVNPRGRAAVVTLRLYRPAGAPVTRTLRIGAHTRMSLDLGRIVPRTRPFGLRVQADQAVAAQMIVHRGRDNPYTLLGSGLLARRWYVAEGYTGLSFHETIYLLNPNRGATRVWLRLLPAGGRRARTVSVVVGGERSLAVPVNKLYSGVALAAIVTSKDPVTIARVQTFGAHGYGATANVGTTGAATVWLFAEGASARRFETFYTVLNPQARTARVTAVFTDTRGHVLARRTLIVGGLRRGTIQLTRIVRAEAVAALLTATLPVVIERPYYFGPPNGGETGGSIVYGRNGTGLTWTFPAGDTTGGGNERLLVFNPNGQTLRVRAIFYLATGRMLTRTFSVPAHARYTLDVRRAIGPRGTAHGSQLVATNGLGFVAEQSIYNARFAAGYGTAGLAQ